jgi:hypothetical protein
MGPCGQEGIWSPKAIDHRAREFAESSVILPLVPAQACMVHS